MYISSINKLASIQDKNSRKKRKQRLQLWDYLIDLAEYGRLQNSTIFSIVYKMSLSAIVDIYKSKATPWGNVGISDQTGVINVLQYIYTLCNSIQHITVNS